MRAARWYRHRYHSPVSLGIVFATIPRLPRPVHPPIALVTAALFFALLIVCSNAMITKDTHTFSQPFIVCCDHSPFTCSDVLNRMKAKYI